MKKRILIIVSICLFIIGLIMIVITFFPKKDNSKVIDDETDINKVIREASIEMKSIGELKVVDSKIVQTASSYDIYLTVKNITGQIWEEGDLKVTIKDSENQLIGETYIKNVKLEVDEERVLQISTSIDIWKDKNYTYILERA